LLKLQKKLSFELLNVIFGVLSGIDFYLAVDMTKEATFRWFEKGN
jgi:hypothetical protein